MIRVRRKNNCVRTVRPVLGLHRASAAAWNQSRFGTSDFFRLQKPQIIGRMGQCTTDRQNGLAEAIGHDQTGIGTHNNIRPERRHKNSPSALRRPPLGRGAFLRGACTVQRQFTMEKWILTGSRS